MKGIETSIFLMFQSPSLRGSGHFKLAKVEQDAEALCFNPLHCGAVVTSRSAPMPRRPATSVSIPFIAGQWSLRVEMRRGARDVRMS